MTTHANDCQCPICVVDRAPEVDHDAYRKELDEAARNARTDEANTELQEWASKNLDQLRRFLADERWTTQLIEDVANRPLRISPDATFAPVTEPEYTPLEDTHWAEREADRIEARNLNTYTVGRGVTVQGTARGTSAHLSEGYIALRLTVSELHLAVRWLTDAIGEEDLAGLTLLVALQEAQDAQ